MKVINKKLEDTIYIKDLNMDMFIFGLDAGFKIYRLERVEYNSDIWQFTYLENTRKHTHLKGTFTEVLEANHGLQLYAFKTFAESAKWVSDKC
jgi:hypothetical protein